MALDFDKLTESPHLLDTLIQMEDVLDQMDCYVFKNWIKGEVVEGPVVRRYWVSMVLRYPFKNMPDPRAGLRLLKHGVRIDYEKAKIDTETFGQGVVEENDDEETNEENLVWLVKISVPRRLIAQMDAAQHDFYDDEVDIDEVEDAKDAGFDDESGYHEDDQNGIDDQDGDPMGPATGQGVL